MKVRAPDPATGKMNPEAIAAFGKTQALRRRFEPVTGRVGLSDEEAKAKGVDFLRAELTERLAKGPMVFNVIAQLAQPQDQLLDPTDPWPADRTTDQACDRETFIPTILPTGIAASADATLAARAASYAVSLSRR